MAWNGTAVALLTMGPLRLWRFYETRDYGSGVDFPLRDRPSDVFAGPAGQAEPRASVGDFGASTNRLVANAEAPAGAGACTPVRSAGTETGGAIRQPTGSGDATTRTSRPNAHRHNHKGW